jgi:hypothetical protein
LLPGAVPCQRFPVFRFVTFEDATAVRHIRVFTRSHKPRIEESLMLRFIRALAVFCLLGSTPLRAQPLYPKPGQERELDAAPYALDSKLADRFGDLREGKRAVADDLEANSALLRRAARWQTYRLTDARQHAAEPVVVKDGRRLELPGMNKLVREAHLQLWLGKPLRKEPQFQTNQRDYIQRFGKELTQSVREVLAASSLPIVRTNAVRILAGVAETGNEEAAETLVELLESAQESDAVKYCALLALEQLFAQGTPARSVIKESKREARCIRVLAAYITRQVEAPEEPAQLEALRWVRRAAIRTLGQTRHATIPGTEDDSGRTAWLLLRIARGEGLTPEPSPAERVEAAIGLCYLRGKTDTDLNLDCVAHRVAGAIVDFTQQANKQRAGTTAAYVPCLKSASRLYRALEHLNERGRQGGDKDVAAYLEQVRLRGQPLLLQVGQGTPADPLPLDDWLGSHLPKHADVYSDRTNATLRTAP